MTPTEVHQIGLERIVRIPADMAKIRADAGFDGTDTAYRVHLTTDPVWRAASADHVTQLFRRYMDRLKPKLGRYFSAQPAATYDAEALPDSLAGFHAIRVL